MTENVQLTFVANREVRRVPRGWQHPKDARGTYVPLLPADYTFDDAEHRASFGDRGLMPVVSGETQIIAYETTTEGTPISPGFPDTPAGKLALVRYCAEHAFSFGRHRASGEAWAAILFGDASIDLDGTVRSG